MKSNYYFLRFIADSRTVTLETKYNPNNNVLTLRKPGVNMSEEWTIELIR